MKNNIIYLPGLNGIRAIAALVVVFSHVNLNLNSFGLKKYSTSDLAGFGVTIFFTLSGFLITYLLLKEKEQFKTINIKKFYIRRILRIWPLYFLFILLGFIINPVKWDSKYNLILLMLPNISFAFEYPMHLFGHFWSLGVEEQFYSFWPTLIKFSKKIHIVLLLFIISFLIIKTIFNIYFGSYSHMYTLIYVTRFDCMAIGGFGAWFMINYLSYVKKFSYSFIEIICWGIIILTAFNSFHIVSILDHEIIAAVTVLIIYQQTVWDRRKIKLENKLFDYLGSISFGIYVYHPLMIYLNALWMNSITINDTLKWGFIQFVIFTSSILAAHLSFYCFESKILRLKSKYSLIESQSKKD